MFNQNRKSIITGNKLSTLSSLGGGLLLAKISTSVGDINYAWKITGELSPDHQKGYVDTNETQKYCISSINQKKEMIDLITTSSFEALLSNERRKKLLKLEHQ